MCRRSFTPGGGARPYQRPNSEPKMLKAFILLSVCSLSAVPATQVVMLGSGTPQPEPERSGPAVAVVYNGRAYIPDSGAGVVRRAAAAATQLKIASLQVPRLNLLFLSHLHSDHTLGLPDLIFSPWVLGRKEPLQVYGPTGTSKMVAHILGAWQEDLQVRTTGSEHANTSGYKVDVHEIKPGIIFAQDNVQITALPVHQGNMPEAFGFKIGTPDKVIVISGDCAPQSPPLSRHATVAIFCCTRSTRLVRSNRYRLKWRSIFASSTRPRKRLEPLLQGQSLR